MVQKEESPSELAADEPFDDPFQWFDRWYAEAVDSDIKNPNALTLATCSEDGQPRARTILLKEWGRRGFVFYTNYRSTKGQDLAANPAASLKVYWRQFDRQFRVEGHTEKLDGSDSDAYFASRSRGSKIGAWASQQSEPLDSREALMERYRHYEEEFDGEEVPRPDHWGGYLLVPSRFVFWRAGDYRLHDRWEFVAGDDTWTRQRLFP